MRPITRRGQDWTARFGKLLQGLISLRPAGGMIRYSDPIRGHGSRVVDRACRLALERIVAKHAASPCREGRSRSWVKVKCLDRQEFVVGGWTDADRLRHAAFRGLREDKDPGEVTREPPADRSREAKSMKRKRNASTGDSGKRVAGVRLTNPDRVLFPEQGCTKRDLAGYYEAVADRILPHLVDRPLTLVRCPQGREEPCFYQKHLTEGMPESVRGIRMEEKEGSALYVGVDDAEGLVTLVQFGVLEIHPWSARADRLDRPDRLVFDLDPGEGVRWKEVVDAALRVRERLGELGLTTFVRTTGGKGIHVVAPLVRRSGWKEVRGFAGDVARGFEREDPDRFIATMSRARRKGRIFVDYLRNSRGATAVASYSTRARAGAPVAMPLPWEALERLSKPDSFTILTVPARLRERREDPWEGFSDLRQSLTRAMRKGAAG